MSSGSETRPCRPDRKGILALVTGNLTYHPFSPTLVDVPLSARIKRRKRPAQGAEEDPVERGQEGEYDPPSSELTLFYFADSTCRNSLRFGPVLAKFIEQVNDDASGATTSLNTESSVGNDLRPPVQCICVPNDDENPTTLCGGMGFWCLPFDHENRAAIIRLLSVSRVPTLIVVNNATGRKITDLGMEAVESNPSGAVEAWKEGNSGLSVASRIGCALS